MSMVLAVASGQFGFWLIRAIANRCRWSTAFLMVTAVAVTASASAILIVKYVRDGGAWYALIVPWLFFGLGLLLYHGLHWLFIEVWCRGQGIWYNLTKKKEVK